MNKIYHKAKKVNAKGQVSALCFTSERAINLTKASWTNRNEAVTCQKCLRVLEQNNDQ